MSAGCMKIRSGVGREISNLFIIHSTLREIHQRLAFCNRNGKGLSLIVSSPGRFYERKWSFSSGDCPSHGTLCLESAQEIDIRTSGLDMPQVRTQRASTICKAWTPSSHKQQAAGRCCTLPSPLQRLRFHLQTAFSTRRQWPSAHRFSPVEGQNLYLRQGHLEGLIVDALLLQDG